ncbi:acyl-protein synthetase [Paraneptunicella aestuarii]|uniref:LuxE/PaaK family acyltransferase n=1 Tax=Paraneptunicella aestuarii TaxID=2831148 RepID=UPI001E34824C|nr:acyl-protein synthetase [Paraneptunicella aestuarii]UAA39503.1 acyl-protein synthetase [Paraneptunicella aestuarii]
MKSADNIPQDELHYETLFNALLDKPVYGVPQEHKSKLLLDILNLLHGHHMQDCPAYFNMFQHQGSHPVATLEELPYMAVRLFKHLTLQSVPNEQVFKTLYSSGTTTQTPAKVVLDRDTSARQSKVLVKILQAFLGKNRLPMLIIDTPSVLKDKSSYSARGAGIQGLSIFGRNHTYALDDNMQPDWSVIDAFCEKHQAQPVLIFGFTFMVWKYFVQALRQQKRRFSLPHGVLLHSGGWKKLESEKVGNEEFKSEVKDVLGVLNVHNFYGMAEQVGSIFVECEQGHLHSPLFADVIIRNPYSLQPVGVGESGIIQVLSALPTSYPGHSLLTEDLGKLLGVDDCPCGRAGKYFQVEGRLPKTETRGCSDTHQPV